MEVMTATLLARDLTLSFGDQLVLDAVDVGVASRDRVGVVGPNGTGKTTLLRVLAGLQTPDRGSVSLAPPTATVGYLPQEPERRPGETVRAFLARRTGVTEAAAELEHATAVIETEHDRYDAALTRWLSLGGADLDARIGPMWTALGLHASVLDHDMSTLSGGQAARASLGAILLAQFDIFLLDEPTNDLDFDGLERLEGFLDALGRGDGRVARPRLPRAHDHERARARRADAPRPRVRRRLARVPRGARHGAASRRRGLRGVPVEARRARRPRSLTTSMGGAGRQQGEEEPEGQRQGPARLPAEPHREAGGEGARHREGARPARRGRQAVGGLGAAAVDRVGAARVRSSPA